MVSHKRTLVWSVRALLSLHVWFASVLLAQTPAQAGKASAQSQPAAPSAEDRQKAMEADVERLVQLARQLKAELERSRQDELSVKVIRDADEIDRLARSARTRIH